MSVQIRKSDNVDVSLSSSGIYVRRADGVDVACNRGAARDTSNVDRNFYVRETKVYPGANMNYVNQSSYGPYGECSNNGSTIRIYTFGGTDTGVIVCWIGPINTTGKSKLYFNTLTRTISIDTQHTWRLGWCTNNTDTNYNNWNIQNFTDFGSTGNVTWGSGTTFGVQQGSAMYLGIHQYSSNNYSGHTCTTTISGIYLQ